MTQRISVICDTCTQGIVFRIGIGGEAVQLFSVACPQCKQKIGLELLLNKKPTSFEGMPIKHFQATVQAYINCSVEKETNQFIAINLHAELLYPKEFIHEKVMLPSVTVMTRMAKYAQEKGIINYDNLPKKTGTGPVFTNLFDMLSGDAKLSQDWSIIKKAYQLKENGLDDLSKNELKKYSDISSLPKNGKYMENIIFEFLWRYISPNHKLYIDIEDEFEKARKLNDEEMHKLSDYYINDLKNLNIKNYIEIFDEYFNNFKDLIGFY